MITDNGAKQFGYWLIFKMEWNVWAIFKTVRTS